MAFRLFVFLSCFVILLSCSNSKDPLNQSLSNPVPYCFHSKTYSDSVTITGKAQYQYRARGNGGVSGPNPIRHAEVRVTNIDGEIIQCTETDSQGNFSVSLPKDDSTALISVVSRAYNNFLKLYVLKDPKTNVFHSLEREVVLDNSKSIGSLVAPATGSLEGGAFNILDKILDTNDFLREKTKNCQNQFSNCNPFTVGEFTTVYWSEGVNPHDEYLGTQKSFGLYSGESFYAHEKNQIYIIGGKDGDVDRSDTDHFDDTIIIHEYGHFIEKFYSNLTSPNGEHDGNDIIDPRLAFAEAWANFLQTQVKAHFCPDDNPDTVENEREECLWEASCYRDTVGTIDGKAIVYERDLEEGDSICGPSQSSSPQKSDVATMEGEGNFREFAITRTLVDIFDENNEGVGIDQLTASFAEFWTLFTSETVGLANKNFYFNNVGRLLELQTQLPESERDWSEVIAAEKLRVGVRDYGNSLELGGTCGSVKIQARDIPEKQPEDGSFMKSNMFDSNDFYEYRHEGGFFELDLAYRGHDQENCPKDKFDNKPDNCPPPPLDIFLYADDYVFGRQQDMITSNREVFDGGLSDEKTLRYSNLKEGVYMINIMVHTGDHRKYNPVYYDMTLNEQKACPK